MSQCATCHAGCCRSYVVPLTGADIQQIIAEQKLSFWDFACRWADPEGSIALKYAPHFFFRDAPEIPYVISLIQEESRNFPGTTKCRFLEEGRPAPGQPLGVAHCGNYAARPSACRVYPTKFDRAGELAVLCDVPPAGKGGIHPVYQLCPQKWQPRDLDPIGQVRDLVVAKYEMNFFFKLARSWNERPGDWRSFPDFLKLVYANRILSSEPDAVEQPDADDAQILKFPRLAA